MRHDLPELILPSSLPEPKPEFLKLTTMERLRVRLHAFRLAYRDYKADRSADYHAVYASLRPSQQGSSSADLPSTLADRARSSSETSTSASTSAAAAFSTENVRGWVQSAAVVGQKAQQRVSDRAEEVQSAWKEAGLGGEVSQTAKAGLSLVQLGVPRAKVVVEEFLGGYRQGLQDAATTESPFTFGEQSDSSPSQSSESVHGKEDGSRPPIANGGPGPAPRRPPFDPTAPGVQSSVNQEFEAGRTLRDR